MTDETPIWERPEPAERDTPSPLSRDRIVRAAIALADAEDLDAVSLRKVAGALDAGPMRLYRYIGTKEELLELMVDAVYAEIPGPAGDGWRPLLRSYAHGIRDAALRHGWFADLLGGRPHFGPATLAHTEATLAALHAEPGFGDVDTVMSAVDVLAVHLIGALRKEIGERRAERATGLSKWQWQRERGPYLMRALATGRYPTLERMVREAAHPDAAASFELGLDYVLDGIEARLGA
ncbi:MAG TPA: TetR/AcrR family transcriptional regulator [Phytomonospora sp.]